MKKSELLTKELEALRLENDNMIETMVKNGDATKTWDEKWPVYWEAFGKNNNDRIRELEWEIFKEQHREIEVGDGATICLHSDKHAGTVIKKTKTTITIQRDKAILDEKFKPDLIPGGFAAHCTNQSEQSYTYECNPDGTTETFHWSEKKGRYQGGGDGSIVVTNGRHEFYDYNF